MSVRYAPSPTGPLHVGNLRTAWVSLRLARHFGLPWVVRFENIDALRDIPGGIEDQTKDLQRLGMVADQTVIQSENRERHLDLFLRAKQQGRVYPCDCSRKEIGDALRHIASAPHAPVPAYTGRCRTEHPLRTRPEKTWNLAWRFRASDPSGAEDFIVARTSPQLDEAILRFSFLPSYDWACAIDDIDGAHSLLVRAIDLAAVLPRQKLVWNWLIAEEKLRTELPSVFHTSLVLNEDGSRIEKRSLSATVREIEKEYGADVLLRGFEKTFTLMPFELSRGAVFGEKRETLSLSDLFK